MFCQNSSGGWHMYRRIVVPKILEPKTVKTITKPKTCLIQDKVNNVQPQKLTFAVAAGSVPPPGGNGPENISPFNKKFTKEFIKKISQMTKDINNFTRNGFDIFKNHNHIK